MQLQNRDGQGGLNSRAKSLYVFVKSRETTEDAMSVYAGGVYIVCACVCGAKQEEGKKDKCWCVCVWQWLWQVVSSRERSKHIRQTNRMRKHSETTDVGG